MDNEQEQIAFDQCHAYFDGSLTLEERAEFLTLVKTNPDYEKIFNQFRRLHELLHDHTEVSPPQHLESRILQAIAKESEKGKPTTLKSGSKLWSFPVKIAAGILLIACAGFTFYHYTFQSQQSGTGTIASAPQTNSTQATNTSTQKSQTLTPANTPQLAETTPKEVLKQPPQGKANPTKPTEIENDPSHFVAMIPLNRQVNAENIDSSDQTNSEDAQLEQDLETAWSGFEELNHQQTAALEENANWIQSLDLSETEE